MSTGIQWKTPDGHSVFDANWNPIPGVVSFNKETGEVQRRMVMHNGLGGPSVGGIATMNYPAPLRVLPESQ
jgi:hypothetical protein